MTEHVEIEGLDELLRKLDPSAYRPAVMGGLTAIRAEVQDKIAPYPQSTEANRPNAKGRWYERGYGPKWMTASGDERGRKTSETLGRRWSIREIPSRLQVILANIASYAPFVHNWEKQALFHKRRGWETDQGAIGKVKRSGVIDRIWEDVVRKWLG